MAKDFFSDMGKAITKQWHRSMDELNDGFGADMQRVIDKTANEGFLQGATEAFDVFSPGNIAAEVLDGFNVIPEDPGLKELVSAGVNLGVGMSIMPLGGVGMMAAGKDLMDAVGACTGADPGAVANRPTEAQTPRRPEDAYRAVCEGALRPMDGKDFTKIVIDGRDFSRPGSNGYCGGSVTDGLRGDYADIIKRIGDHWGKDKTDQADSAIDKLLKNPNLCFEDLIFMLMRLVVKQGRDEVKDLAKGLKDGRAADKETRDAMGADIDKLRGQVSAATDPKERDRLNGQLQSAIDKRAEFVSDRSESRAEVAEELKNALQKLSEMQQAMSNILNTQHETAMAAIRNIR